MMPIQKPFSDKYVSHRLRGPFPGQIDPWAEVGRYFNSIHAGMIGDLMAHIQRPLMEMGYEAGREASMQIFLQSETPELQST